MEAKPGTGRGTVIGLTLSGGGMRGLGHLGIIMALEQFGLKPDMLSGSSAGAIVGCFYAAGYSPADMLAIAESTNFFSYSNFRPHGGGWFSTAVFEKVYREHFPDHRLESLPIPMYVAATDVGGGRTEYFREGDICQALLASACMPMVFAPVNFNGKVYLDGGLINNLPIEPIKDKCDYLIGSHVNSLEVVAQPMGTRKILDRAYHLVLSSSVYSKAPFCNLFIDPPKMARFSLFDKKDIRKMIDYTYDFSMRHLEKERISLDSVLSPHQNQPNH